MICILQKSDTVQKVGHLRELWLVIPFLHYNDTIQKVIAFGPLTSLSVSSGTPMEKLWAPLLYNLINLSLLTSTSFHSTCKLYYLLEIPITMSVLL